MPNLKESLNVDLKTLKLTLLGSDKLFHILGLDLRSTWTILLDLDSFYDKLYLESKKTRAVLLDFAFSLCLYSFRKMA